MTEGERTIDRFQYHYGRLYNRCVARGSCLIWIGPVVWTGHGQISYKRKMRLIHRYAWFLEHGEWPPGQLNHRCGQPRCVALAHLYLGTQRLNAFDALMHGTWLNQRLTADKVEAIRSRHAAGGVTQAELAVEFGVSRPTISNVVRRRTWTHLEESRERVRI